MKGITETITIDAMAKINLGLDVVRRREDGYHEVKMVMQTIKLYDTLVLTIRDEPGIVVRTDRQELPADKDNLIARAAKVLYENYPIKKGVEISLTKRIPIAAGMAGGSTDAAATLVGMNRLLGLGCSEERLKELGVTIGADIPYCIQGGTVLSEGIGEKLTALPALAEGFVVIAKPKINVSTKYVYEHLHVDRLQKHPDIDGMVQAIQKKDLSGIAVRMENVLETVTEKEYPVIGRLKQLLKREGALNALMSGSGPTVFGIFSDKDRAEAALERVEASGMAPQCFCTTFAPRAQVFAKQE